MSLDLLIVVGSGVLAMAASWGYFRRFQVTRPPIGVFNLRDVAILLAGIAVVPYVYLWLPFAAVAALLTITTGGVLWFTLEPVLRRRALILAVAAVAVVADIWLALGSGTTSNAFLAVNDVLLVVAVAGVANLWVQSGMGAREVTALAGALALYDFVATSQLTLMTDLIGRLSQSPFVPFVAWNTAGGQGLGIGLGDLLLLSAIPLAMRKTFSRTAGLVALGVGLASLVGVLLVVEFGVIDTAMPVMVVLGPLAVAQYLHWSRRLPQRTTWQYFAAEPLPATITTDGR